MKKLRIAFMGTPDFAVSALRALHQSDHDVVCVYSQPPRPKGRGQKTQASPVHLFAQDQNIPVFHPLNFKTPEAVEEFQSHALDIAIVAAYGLILPETILNAPRLGCLNIHASLLPRWRGASPIQRAIWEGDTQTGITIMQMDKGLDTGDMLAKQAISITQDTTTHTLHDTLSQIGGEMSVDIVNRLAREENIKREPQENTQTTYAPLLKKEDGRIDWTQPATQIDRQIRALNPWPGVWCMVQDQRLKIGAASVSSEKSDAPAGTILDKNGHIACGEASILKLQTLQPAGSKAMDFASALNGGKIKIGDILS